MKSKFLTVFMIIVILCECCYIVYAAKSDQLKSNLSSKNEEIDAKSKEVDQKEQELNKALAEVEDLKDQISEYDNSIYDLKTQISSVENQISEKESTIQLKQKEYDETKELFEKRLIAIYQTGDTSYLELLLSSQDLSDFISKYYLVSELATCDKNLIETIRTTQNELEVEKQNLEKNKTDLVTAKTELEAKQAALAAAKKVKDEKASQLSSEEKALEKELDDLRAESKEIERAIKEALAAESSSGNVVVSTPSACGYIFPVAGLSKKNINNLKYPSYSGHTGVDVNINVRGKSVVAVKEGTVLISKAYTGNIKNYDENGKEIGKYASYGEYVLIMHNDGTQTLYAHMKAGSRTVVSGQKVQQGQVLGIVGNTGNVSPRPTASSPYNGTHLHFEVRVNGRAVNPIPYLP